jgi:hypothetical protein
MIYPISLQEYMDKISKKYQSLPGGPEKEKLWLEIKEIAEKAYPTVVIEDISNNENKSE